VELRGRARIGPAGALGRLRRLVQLIEAVHADVVHAFCRRSELFAILAARWAGRGRVLGVRRNIGYWHNGFTRWTARIVGLGGAAYAANCEAAREFATRVEWIPRRRVSVIQNPLLTSRRQEGLASVPPRSALGILDGEQVVGMVATIRPIKDYGTFLRSARLVLDKHSHTRFLAIGDQDPDYAREMRQLAHDLGINGHVSWVGRVANPLSVLPLVDVAVLSSRSEGFSNALLEYATAGAAIVVTNVGGVPEIVDDGAPGFLVPPRSPELMANRCCGLLEDESLRKRLGQNAQRRVRENWSQETILEQYATLYRRLAGK
jgi:glycosyltransferase involved in cell wall biosynthesis